MGTLLLKTGARMGRLEEGQSSRRPGKASRISLITKMDASLITCDCEDRV